MILFLKFADSNKAMNLEIFQKISTFSLLQGAKLVVCAAHFSKIFFKNSFINFKNVTEKDILN